MYLVTKKFISGNLSGIVVTEKTNVPFALNKTYKNCAGKGSYMITNVISLKG